SRRVEMAGVGDELERCVFTTGISGRRQTVFFFQAEDGIRDKLVTGVQTCALPICATRRRAATARKPASASTRSAARWASTRATRSEERRVGKECRSRWTPSYEKTCSWRELQCSTNCLSRGPGLRPPHTRTFDGFRD